MLGSVTTTSDESPGGHGGGQQSGDRGPCAAPGTTEDGHASAEAATIVALQPLTYLEGYPPETLERVRELLAAGELGRRIAQRYPGLHGLTTNKLLHDYVMELKQRHMKTAPAVSKVTYDDRLMAVQNALGLHTFESRSHGAKLRARSDIRIAGVFRAVAPEFLRMIVVHELAHLRERDHTKAFYRLCESMEPEYHQLELDLRLWLTAREIEGERA
jgi:predicted metal-dependent hydrolase